MTNELIKMDRIFESKEFGQIRTVIIEGVVWFVAKDVAKALGYKKPENAIKVHVSDEDKTTTLIQGTGSNYKCKVVLINESGLYSLIFASKLESAQRFKFWVTSEVLPEIRQTGSYNSVSLRNSNGQINTSLIRELLDDEERLQKQVEQQQFLIDTQHEQIEEQQDQIGKMEPKCDYYDKVLSDSNTMCVTSISKDYGMSPYELNKLLHTFGVQYKVGNQWILYQKYADKGYTKSIPFTYNDFGGVNMTTQWTQKGRLFIYQLLKEHGILPTLEQNLV